MLTPTALALGLLSAAFIAGNILCSRLWVKDSESPLAFSLLYTAFSAVLSLCLIVLEPWQFEGFELKFLLLLVLSAILYGLYDATQFSARKYTEASVFSLLSQLSPIITTILSIIIFGEHLTTMRALAILLVVTGNLVVLYKAGGTITTRGLLFGLSAATAVGAAYAIDKVAFEHFPIPLYSMAVYVVPFFVVATIFAMRGGAASQVTTELRRITWRAPALSLLGVGGYYCLLKTFQIADASVAVPLVYSSSVIATIGGIVLLRERTHVWQKLAGAALVFVGVVLLQY